MSFTGKSPKNTYKDILQIDNSNSGVDSTTRSIKTSEGSSTAIGTSDRAVKILPSTDNTAAFTVANASDSGKFIVDTTNNAVTALGHNINTQYAYFGVSSSVAANFVANEHHVLPFAGNGHAPTTQDNFNLGTSTDPETSFTTADGSDTDASVVVPCLWLLPDNITIDSVISLEGGNNATGATTRMHLMSYDFTSGSTSCLTNGALIAYNSDVTNAGSEQAYKSTWTVDSSDISADKVLAATFFATNATGDYSTTITIKYHLR